MWKQLGVETELFNTEVKVHYNDLQEGNFEVARAGWIADYNDPQNFLYLMDSATGVLNYAGYASPEFDRLMAEASRPPTVEKQRNALLHEAEAVAMADMPNIPIYYYVSKDLVAQARRGLGRQHQGHPPHALALGRALTRLERAAAAPGAPPGRPRDGRLRHPPHPDQHPDAAGDRHGRVLHDAHRARRPVRQRARAAARDREERARGLRPRPAAAPAVPRLSLGRAAGRLRAVVQVPRLHGRRAADRPAFRRASRSAASRSLLAIVVGIGARHARGAAPEHRPRPRGHGRGHDRDLDPELRHGAAADAGLRRLPGLAAGRRLGRRRAART